MATHRIAKEKFHPTAGHSVQHEFTKIHWNAGFKPLWYLAPFAFVNRYLMTRTWTRSLGRIQGVVDSRLP